MTIFKFSPNSLTDTVSSVVEAAINVQLRIPRTTLCLLKLVIYAKNQCAIVQNAVFTYKIFCMKLFIVVTVHWCVNKSTFNQAKAV